MSSVRQSGTSAELAVRRIVHSCGIDYETNVNNLPGTPDLVNRENMWAIFVNGCFWHAHEGCSRWKIPKNNRAFWEKKFSDNRQRDKKNIDRLEEIGYSVLVVWECELDNEKKLEENIYEFFRRPYEEFEYSPSHKTVVRVVHLTDGQKVSTRIHLKIMDLNVEDTQSAFDYAFLRKLNPPRSRGSSQNVRGADLFCGCGGLSLGAMEACRAMGKRFLPIAAVDTDPIALKVYERNFRPSRTYAQDIRNILDGSIGSEPTDNEHQFLNEVKDVDILLAGPPCQGHSDLNNYTRRDDPRNALYERVARFVEIVEPEHVLIENVPTIIYGKERTVQRSIDNMRELGYKVDSGIVDLAAIGVPQKRRRHVVIASISKTLSIREVIEKYSVKNERSVSWAIGDLEDEPPNGIFNTPSRHTETNMQRIKHLHANDVYDLPNSLRPQCHRNGDHSYKSMYGRIKPNEPAQTITSGFGSPGQGRFIHPTRLRTLTPHEAARLQFFPDFFDFSLVRKRTSLAEMVGNAAPMKLSYVFCLELLA